MTLVTNGVPKSGNHALAKACQLLGQPCGVQHVPAAALPADTTHHVLIVRDPRNVVLSWIRAEGQPLTAGMYLTAIRRFEGGGSLITVLAGYEPYLTDGRTHVVRYEDLIASEAAMRGIAAFLGVPYLDGAFEDLPGLTRTWHPAHADYRTIWTPQVEAAWQAEGGPEVLARWNY